MATQRNMWAIPLCRKWRKQRPIFQFLPISSKISVFLTAPSFSELERRLRGRGDTVGADLERRLKAARDEYAQAPKYDYIVVNDRVERCADEVMAILTADKCRAKYRLDLLKEDD